MSSQVEVIAIISPKEGKVDRVVELLNGVSEYVQESEPGTLKYQIVREVNRKFGVEQIMVLETYKNKEAIAAHGCSDAFKNFQNAVKDEDLIAAPAQLKFVKTAGGFATRL